MVRKVQGQIIVPSPVHEIPEGYRLFNFILLLKVSFVKLYIHFFFVFLYYLHLQGLSSRILKVPFAF